MRHLVCRSLLVASTAAALAACGSDEETCDLAAQTGCDDGKVCEPVEDGEPQCFAPVVVRGGISDVADASAIAGGRVVALDVNRAPVSSVAESGDDGAYELAIPSTRTADGTPVGVELTLRADASGYASFPDGLRQALPIDTATAVKADDGRWVVESALTEIGLIGLPADAGTATLRGRVDVPDDHVGVLVVAEAGGKGYDAIADRDGTYAIFNLPAASFTVDAYALGHVYDRVTVDIAAGASATADLALSSATAGSVNGSVSIVNAPGGSATSVVMFVESTLRTNKDDPANQDPFTLVLGGAAPPGLRAPEAGIAPNVAGAFTIDGVPPGRYVILAGFENDGLVRDPDECISGTDIVHVEVRDGEAVTIGQQFKITEALSVITPGSLAAETVEATPTLSWQDDSSEDQYLVRVYDALGQEVWSQDLAGVSGGTPQVAYDGPLDAGMYYQFRVVSARRGACAIATTEDLRGVFYVP